MKRSCDTCHHFVMSRGLVPHYVCMEADTKPEDIQERIRHNGRDCPYWRRKVRIVGNTLNNRRY